MKIKRTLDDGNCFYSAIYRSLKFKNLLNNIYICLPELKSSTEKSFIHRLRYYIINNIKPQIKILFNRLIEMYLDANNNSSDKKIFNATIKGLGDISNVIKKFINNKKFNKKYEDDFINEINKNIITDKTWAGELQVIFVQEKFNDICNIKIKIYRVYKQAIEAIKKDMDNNTYNTTLYLINKNETHYEFI